MAQLVKNPPAMWETWVRSLAWEDPLEEGMVTHCSILSWRIPKDRGAWLASAHGVTKSRARVTDKAQHRTVPNRYIHGTRNQTEVRLTLLVIISRKLFGEPVLSVPVILGFVGLQMLLLRREMFSLRNTARVH